MGEWWTLSPDIWPFTLYGAPFTMGRRSFVAVSRVARLRISVSVLSYGLAS